jgi:hypothetical protein
VGTLKLCDIINCNNISRFFILDGDSSVYFPLQLYLFATVSQCFFTCTDNRLRTFRRRPKFLSADSSETTPPVDGPDKCSLIRSARSTLLLVVVRSETSDLRVLMILY